MTGGQTNGEKRALARDIDRAESFERRPSHAVPKREKASIHSECSNALGNSSLGKVIKDKHVKLESVRRTIGKLEKRLRSDAKLASVNRRKSLVIDGSNLCYQHGSEVIGLSALNALAQNLSTKYDVTIVFDGTLRSHLKSSGVKIASRFTGNVSVLVLASRLKADEAVLDTATYPDMFAISNDGIKDFRKSEQSAKGGFSDMKSETAGSGSANWMSSGTLK